MDVASPDIDDSSRRHNTMASKLIKNKGREPAILTLRSLQDATLGFPEHRVLGEGPHGKVYLGLHDNGEKIAIKLFHRTMRELDDSYFHNEFDILRMVDHQSIIKLVGYCYETVRELGEFEGSITERTHKALCFEYMHNGSLEEHLSNECSGFDWHTRYKIIKGTCDGLKHLHEDLEEPLYHLDLTPSNILLDENMMPKLSGFGSSKLHEQTRVPQSQNGTLGYLPPEYLFGNVVANKLDIFTLGVVMIKIIAGPRGLSRSTEMPYQEFIDQVNENWRYRFEEEQNYAGPLEACCKQVNRCTEIAMSCKNNDRDKRPSILDIIQKLNKTDRRGNAAKGAISKTEGCYGSFSKEGSMHPIGQVDGLDQGQIHGKFIDKMSFTQLRSSYDSGAFTPAQLSALEQHASADGEDDVDD